MSETFHIENLLRKDIKRNISEVSEAFYFRPRYGVKGAAIQVIDSLIELFSETYQAKESRSKIEIKYSLFADSSESDFSANVQTSYEEFPVMQGDFFEAFPDLYMTLFASNDHTKGDPPISPDAVYIHDHKNSDDIGEIEMHIYLPRNHNDIFSYLEDKRLEIAGVLSHEMQHVVQKHIYNEVLSSTAGDDLLSHAFDINEIDARVEEAITAMGDDTPVESKDEFIFSLERCLDDYLSRNVTDKDEVSVPKMKEKMMAEHLVIYENKLKGVL